jgi:hypothetical protein
MCAPQRRGREYRMSFCNPISLPTHDCRSDDTGYQFERADDALQVKLRAFIADELRTWEKTFPDELLGRVRTAYGLEKQPNEQATMVGQACHRNDLRHA